MNIYWIKTHSMSCYSVWMRNKRGMVHRKGLFRSRVKAEELLLELESENVAA
jgi:hypothetical protein